MEITILGAGYAGIFTAANLCNHSGMKVTLIDKNPYHQLLQQIHTVASGIKKPENISLSIKELFQNELSFIQGSVQAIDLINKTIYVDNNNDNSRIWYDYLIIALGSSSCYYGISGAQEYTYPFRSIDDAIKLKKVIDSLISGSTIIICGGGATGTSIAGALSDTISSSRKIKIKIMEAQNNILPGWDKRIIEMATETLLTNNVEIVVGSPIKEITQSSIILQSGKQVESDLIIWAAGINGFNVKTTPQIEKTRAARILVDNYSRVKGYENVFAIGDISAFTLSDSKIAPQLAQFAVRQARSVAKNIIHNLKGEEMEELTYSSYGQILSFGKKCIGLFAGLPITGNLCEYAEDFIINNYIYALKMRVQGLSALVYDNNIISDFSTLLNFITYATMRMVYNSEMRIGKWK
ncbi:MAG TPA: NAD(P)/FAD-dependent oxidoreductase [Candidatus Bathyarchaeia archaeon]|nr:NAD(P)/FAD-dependent oxidoreductase [Candidatus Bathyarchaeia archaeon]